MEMNSLDYYKKLPQFKKQIENMTSEEIKNSLSSSMQFGTSGVRAEMGFGSNKLNIFTVIKIVAGVCEYLKSINKKNVIICFDTRVNSKEFALVSYKVCKYYNLKAKIFKESTPTPVLSYAIKTLGFDMGINITASHNPSNFNGIKIVNEIGAQINEKISNRISAFIKKINEFTIYDNLKEEKIFYVSNKIKTKYLNFCLKNIKHYSKPQIKVLYTALNGTGTQYFTELLQKRNFNYNLVKEQTYFDGNFPTCPSPNPELESAYEQSLKVQKGEDIIVATDPDSDRLGVMCKHNNQYVLLTGNEIGKIFTYFLINNSPYNVDSFIVTTVVTSRAIQKLCKLSQIEYYETLTGFKNLAEKTEEKSKSKKPLLMFEESCGYEVTGILRDKDGLSAGLFIVEIANFYASHNMTLVDLLEEIDNLSNYSLEKSKSYYIDNNQINEILNNLRNDKYKILKVKEKIDYLESRKTKLPKSNFLKLVLSKGEVIIRPSGTEPKLKVYVFADGENKEKAQAKIKTIFNLIEKNVLKIKE